MQDETRLGLEDELMQLQGRTSGPFILYEAAPIGLGGQISGRVGALIAGLTSGRTVIFSRDDDPPYSQAFVSMIPSPEIRSWVLENAGDAPDFEWGQVQQDSVVKLSPFRTQLRDKQAQAAASAFMNQVGKVFPSFSAMEGAVYNWFRLTPTMHDYVTKKINELEVSRKTLGVHVRRGDKQVESAFIPLNKIQDKVNSIIADSLFDSIYLASDSPSVLHDFVAPEGIKVIFDADEQRYNNANHKMLFANNEMSDQETKTAIFNIEALKSCGGVVGQDNAHFAVIAANSIKSRRVDPIIYLFPKDFAEKSSVLKRFLFPAKRRFRAVLRFLLPWATIRHRAGKIGTSENEGSK